MYIRTENKKCLDSREYSTPYVKPHTETEWDLCIDKGTDETLIIIGTFENVGKANAALDSLNKAIKDEKGWDAIFHKENDLLTTVGL